jgi:hypothetical protein
MDRGEIISETARQSLRQNISSCDPALKRLEKVDVLGRHPDITLTELSRDEGIIFAVIEALSKMETLKREEGVRLPGVVEFFNLLRLNRVALDRKGIDEYLKAIIGQPQTAFPQLGNPGSLNVEDRPGLISRLMFWRKPE